MAETTIQWADYTFNPWVGCQRVSPGCEHCYAEAYDKRVGGVPIKQRVEGKTQLRWGPSAPRTRTSTSYWKQPLKWDREAQAAGMRKRVFCASLADVFEDRPELIAWRSNLFDLIATTPFLDWMLLTKRPENIRRLWPQTHQPPGVSTWSNVWLGCTVEDQQRANERIPHLIAVPAAVRFLSCEPLLEAINLSKWLDEDRLGFVNSEIDWIIVGGESGAKARPFDVAWARSLIQQCRDGGRSVEPTPFVKQLGANIRTRNDDNLIGDYEGEEPGWFLNADWQIEENLHGFREDHQGAEVRIRLRDHHGGDPAEWPADLRVREFPEVRHG